MNHSTPDVTAVGTPRSIKAAVTLGGRGLVDGIIILAEHGDYPYTEDGQHIYPRRHIFEQACGVLAEQGAARPIFNDKHLSYLIHCAFQLFLEANMLPFDHVALVDITAPPPWKRYSFADAEWMVHRAAALGCPLASGSSLPFAWRKPYLEHPIGTELSEAIIVVRLTYRLVG